jgi:hypothetical protein
MMISAQSWSELGWHECFVSSSSQVAAKEDQS